MNVHAGIAILIGLIANAPAAYADTLRCGSRLIEPGATTTDVLGKCGEPTARDVVTEPVRARTAAGGTRVIGTTQKEIWRYARGSGKFPAILTFEDGVLKALEFEK